MGTREPEVVLWGLFDRPLKADPLAWLAAAVFTVAFAAAAAGYVFPFVYVTLGGSLNVRNVDGPTTFDLVAELAVLFSLAAVLPSSIRHYRRTRECSRENAGRI